MIDWLLAPFGGNGHDRKPERWDGGSASGRARRPLGAVPVPFRDSVPDIAAELDRARRYEHPLTMVVLTLHRPGERPPGENRIAHVMALLSASILAEVLRESDIATYDAVAGRYVLALPETDGEAARQAVRRLDRLIHRRVAGRIRAGMAVFPPDGLTLRQLLERGQAAWKEDPLPLDAPRDGGQDASGEPDAAVTDAALTDAPESEPTGS